MVERAHRLTSIVVVADADPDTTRACLAAIGHHTDPGSYELIVVGLGPRSTASSSLTVGHDLRLVSLGPDVGRAAALNAGVSAARGDDVLFLHDRVTVTPGYLPNLLEALYSDPAVAAVGPAAEGIPGQGRAAGVDRSPQRRRDQRLHLSSECLLVKREAFTAAGGFDEHYRLSALHDDELSLRLIASGRKLVWVPDVVVDVVPRPASSHPEAGLGVERRRFVNAWGFDPAYSTIRRTELVALIGPHPPSTPITVLEIGCACGANLLEIKNRYPNADAHGVELNEGAAAIGSRFADVRRRNAEEPLDYPEEFFDYVITADVLEHLADPWRVVAAIRPHLKESGKVIASIPNLMHFSVLRSLLNGRFSYQDAGILDRTHLRFFTLAEIDDLFAAAGYGMRSYIATTVPATEDDLLFVKAMEELSSLEGADQFHAYQYLATVAKSPATSDASAAA